MPKLFCPKAFSPFIGMLEKCVPRRYRHGLSRMSRRYFPSSRIFAPNTSRRIQRTRARGNQDRLPVLLTAPTLEVVLKGLHDSEIRYAIQNEPPVGGITAWIDFGNRTEKATFYGTIVGISTSGQQPIASRRGCTRPRCASSLIAPMPKRTKSSLRAPPATDARMARCLRNQRCFCSRGRGEVLHA